MEKKEKIKLKINEFTDKAIDKAAEEGRLDYFHLEIINHQGKIKTVDAAKEIEQIY